MSLLEIENLNVTFGRAADGFRAVDGVSLSLGRGEVVGIVGESGSGKSVTSLAVMGLIGYPGRVRADRLDFAGRDLLALPAAEREAWLDRASAGWRGFTMTPAGLRLLQDLRHQLLDRATASRRRRDTRHAETIATDRTETVAAAA